jgi:hypothetical protein
MRVIQNVARNPRIICSPGQNWRSRGFRVRVRDSNNSYDCIQTQHKAFPDKTIKYNSKKKTETKTRRRDKKTQVQTRQDKK